VTTERFVSPFELSYTYKRSLGSILGPFATGLLKGVLLGACTADGRVLFPPREYDPLTGADVAPELVVVGPGGVVTSWTAEGQTGDGWVLVRVDGTDTDVLHRGIGPLKTGDRVLPVWADERTGTVQDLLGFCAAAGRVYTPPDPVEVEPVTRFEQPTKLSYVVTAGEMTQSFLTSIMKGKLVGRRCPHCEMVYVPPRGSCPTCAEPCVEPVELAGEGTVATFSIIRIPFEGQLLTPPYACAHVVLDGADVPLLHIIGECAPDDVHMGMRVEAVWAETLAPTLSSIRYFRPTGEPDADPDSYKGYI
jgi:hypothetical protein